ncbi:MAG: hypothetical protein QGI21_00135 [Candidatus Poseidoniaceae archaeon]|nr:hypothetical protein [Candidatus Poseidoniaceae archaeon]
MELGSWLMVALLGGAFLFGIWYMLVSGDRRNDQQMTINREQYKRHGTPDFSKARDGFDKKLAQVERHLSVKRRAEDIRRQAKEDALRVKAEEEALRLAEEEAAREAEIAAEEERKQAEYEAKRQAELEEARRLAEEREAERLAEEERLAAEREAERQVELAAAEEQRLAELKEQEEAEELAAEQASEEALVELDNRLEREGAKRSEVQVSLMWDNYNDLDLHIVCPSGERIHGGNKNSECGGELDVDANVRPETKKPIENVVWPDYQAKAGTYKVYVHHYKKHRKRRSKDPTSFRVICNAGGEVSQYEGELSNGDPISLVCEFTLETPKKRDKRTPEEKEMAKMLEEEKQSAEQEAIRQEELVAAESERLKEIADQEAAELEAIEATNRAMAELKERLEREGAKSSDVQISLIWNNYNDLDLHVLCPSGERIHGGNRESSCGGELDVDANVRPETKKPIENVVWPVGKAPGGTYKAYVHHYKKHKKRRAKDPTKFKLICNAAGEIKEYEGEVSNGDPILLVSEFTLEPPEKRAAKTKADRKKLKALERGESGSASKSKKEEETQDLAVLVPQQYGDLVEELTEEEPKEEEPKEEEPEEEVSNEPDLSDVIEDILEDED